MEINAQTKIAHLIKAHPEALDIIVDIDPKFEKLKNPLLRKLFAGRTTIAMASKIAGVPAELFYDKLRPLGFQVVETKKMEQARQQLPEFILQLTKENVVVYDVRPLLSSGQDPLKLIMEQINNLKSGQALKVMNTFEPVPLIKMLGMQGYKTYVDHVDDMLYETYFQKSGENEILAGAEDPNAEGWNQVMERYQDCLVEIDVRTMSMPQPMHTILGALQDLAPQQALYVYHKRIPVFLLPELRDQGFEYRVKEIEDGDVRLLIYRS